MKRDATRNTPLPDPKEKEHFVRSMFDDISARYDLVNRIMTFGLDQSWRKRALRESSLKSGERLLDVATGTGDFLVLARTTTSNAVGLDISLGMLKNGRSEQPLIQGSALELPFADESIDVITCGFALRNFTEIPRVLAEFHRVLKVHGRLAILEVSTPSNFVVKVLYNIYFNKVVPELGALLSNASAYRYLPASVAYLPSSIELINLLTNVGFSSALQIHLTLGVSQLLLAKKD